jgi:hypothetical protein
MARNIKVEWEIEDGYAGGVRPQTTMVDPSDFIGLTRKEAEATLSEIMQEAFLQRVGWECKDFDASLAEIRAAAAELEAGNA